MKEKQTEEEEEMRHLRIVEKNNKINKRTTIERKRERGTYKYYARRRREYIQKMVIHHRVLI